MSDIVERLEAELQQIGGCHDRDCKVFVTPGMHTNGGCRCLRDAYTGQRVFRAYKRAVDDQDAEITRLRSLVEEARQVVERCQAVLAIMIKLDMTVSSMNAYTLCVEAEARSRSLLDKMKEG